MKISVLLITALIATSMTSAAQDEVLQYNVSGVNVGWASVCDTKVLEAIRIEVAQTFCLMDNDPTCLKAYFSANLNLPHQSLSSTIGPTKRYYDRYMQALTDPTRLASYRTQASGYLTAALANLSKGPEVLRERVASTLSPTYRNRHLAFQQESNTFLQTVLGVTLDTAGMIPGYAGIAAGAIDIARQLFGISASTTQNQEVVSCSVQANNFIPAVLDARGRCVAAGNISSGVVLDFFEQPAATQNAHLSQKSTCSYYNTLLLSLHAFNRTLAKTMVETLDRPTATCMGRGSSEFKLGVTQTPGHEYSVRYTAPHPNSDTPRIQLELSTRDPVITPFVKANMITASYPLSRKTRSLGEIRTRLPGQQTLTAVDTAQFTSGSSHEFEALRSATVASAIIGACCDSNQPLPSCIEQSTHTSYSATPPTGGLPTLPRTPRTAVPDQRTQPVAQ